MNNPPAMSTQKWDEQELLSTEEFQLRRAEVRVAGFAEVEGKLVDLESAVGDFSERRSQRNIFGVGAGLFDAEGV
jgi:hypothetical protein